jgi:GT2 family glycosyltransferase
MNEPPDEVSRLAQERAKRRRARDFRAADELRGRIRALGFEVTDRPDGGFDLTPVEARPAAPSRIHPEEVRSVLDEAPTADVTVQWLSEGWPDDVRRGIASFHRFDGGRSVQHVVVESTPEPPEAWPEDVEVIRLAEDPGFGAARNAGLRRSLGRVVILADGSVEADGDSFGPLEQTLADPSVGVAGPYGLVTDDLRDFREAEGPMVDAVEGYLMAFRRELLAEGLAFDDRYRFYRTADVDLSFQAKALGLRVVRVEVPVRRHEHRQWATTSEEDRERLSKRNFYRFLDKFRGRKDLLVSAR